jgi:hypothetical protein
MRKSAPSMCAGDIGRSVQRQMNRIGDNLMHFGPNEEIVRSLLDAKAQFIVVGGLAVSWHCPERGADDMDLLVEPAIENSARICSALTQLGLTGFDCDSFNRFGLQVPLKQNNYYADLLTPEPAGLSYHDVEIAAVCATLFNLPVRVASVDVLLHMKRRAASASESHRQKHDADIALLERVSAGRIARSESR